MTTEMLERLLIDAERAFDSEDYIDGKINLEDALALEPTCGRAHSYLGWLYLCQLRDFEKAEMHLKLAMKYEPNYADTYIHMVQLLFDLRRLDEYEMILIRAAEVPGIEPAFLAHEMGKMYEVQGHLRKAMREYRKAIQWTLDDSQIDAIEEDLSRCRRKLWLRFF